MTDEYLGAVQKKTQPCTGDLTCVCCVAVDVSSPSHFVLVGQVAQMLNEHFHPVCRQPGPVRPGRWTQRFIPVRCTKQPVRLGGERPSSSQFRLWCPSHLFKKTSNFRLYANPARLTRRCSISPKYFTWCLISRSSSRPACESRPLTQSHSRHVHSSSAGLIAYLAAWIHWASGSGCTTPPWPRGSPSALAGCS